MEQILEEAFDVIVLDETAQDDDITPGEFDVL